MPKQSTVQRVRRMQKKGKSSSAQAGEFVRKVIDDVREKKHGVRNTKQAIAIGLSEARRAGVKLPAPKKRTASAATRTKAAQDMARGKKPVKAVSAKRSKATTRALKREGHTAVSRRALSAQTKKAAGKRTAAQRSASAKKAARTRKAAK